MSIELPGWVVDIFYMVGLPWPGVDEDELKGWGNDLRRFADEITTLSGMSHDAIQQLSGSDQSAFVATMARHWDHHHEQIKAMREPLHVFAGALDIAADAVTFQKGVVIAAAIALATAVGVTQGEALVTFGIAEAEVPVEVEIAKKAIQFALQELENKLLGYLINKAAADISSHLNSTISKMLMGGLGVANEAYALKTDTKSLRALAKTINTHARRTESTSDEAYRHSTNRKIETDGKGGRWPIARVLEQALIAVAADIFRHLPGTLHQVMEDTEKDLVKAAETLERADATLAADADHIPHPGSGPGVVGEGAAAGAVGVAGGVAGVRPPGEPVGPRTEPGAAAPKEPVADDHSGGPVKPSDPAEAGRDGQPCVGDPIDIATGEMQLGQTDVSLPGALPLELSRKHLSNYRWGTFFGPSWASTLDQRLHLDQDDVVFVAAGGMRLVYPVPRPDGPVLPSHGPRWPLRWDGQPGSPMRVTNPSAGETYLFDHPQAAPDGTTTLRLSAIEDRNGRRNDITWAEDGTPALIAHHGGYRIAVDRHPELPRITAFRLLDTDGPGTDTLLARYGYGQAGNLTEVYNSSGIPARFTYDERHRITSWTDRNGSEYRYEYDAAGRVTRTTGPDGVMSSTLAYDEDTLTATYTDSLGHSSIYQHNDAYRLIRATDPLGNVTVQEWSEDNRVLTRVTDPLGRVTGFEYDEAENITAVVYPDASRATVTSNERGLPVEMTDPAGRIWRTEYDERGNRLATIDPLGARTSYTYDENGNVTSVTDPVGVRRQITHNAAGLPITVTDPLGVTTASRDAFGRIVESTDALSNMVRVGWTIEGQVTWCERADGRRESWSYDAEGNVIGYTDAEGRTTSQAATHFDLTSTTTAQDGTAYRFVHDTERRLIQVVNPHGLTWDYEYDPVGRLLSENDFDGRTLRYTYDSTGLLASRTNGAGETVTFTRDDLGRVVEYRDGFETTRYEYDASGNLHRSSNAHTEIVREHDALGRVLSETVNGRRTTYTYDILGRITARRTPTGIVSTWSYDDSLPQALTVGDYRTSFAFDALGRETLRTLGDSLTLSQSWYATGRLTTQTVTHAAAPGQLPIQQRTYTYRSDDFLTAIEELSTGTRRFDVDGTGRVTAVQARGWTEQYAYDALGNLTRAATPLSRPEETDREVTGTRLHRAGRTRYEHDGQGRIVRTTTRLLNGQKRIRTFTWNPQDQLVATVTPEGTEWRYAYDPAGRRIAKQRLAPDGSVAEEIRFSWADARLIEQQNAAGHVTTWEYIPGTHHPLAQLEHSTADDTTDARFHAIITDLIGTPTELVSPAGEVAWQQRTTLWGVPVTSAQDDTADCPLRFPGQYADAETGWNFNYFRHYDPATGHYATPDPLGLGPSPNPSAYVPNPNAWSDPLGLAKYRDLPGWDNGEPKDPTWGGNVVYGSTDAHGRATKVVATIHKEMLGQVTGPKGSMRTMPGWDNKAVYNKTHLLAASLGGSNTMPENFVVAHRYANAPIMSYYEDQIAKAVNNGHVVTYTVTPIYKELGPGIPTPEDLRPIGMTIHATSPQGFTFYAHSPDEDIRRANRAAWEADPKNGFNHITILNVPKRCT